MVSSEELQKLSRTQDPFQLVERDIFTLSGGIKDLLGSDHPVLATCAKYAAYFFLLPSSYTNTTIVFNNIHTYILYVFNCRYFFEIDGGKKIRPTMVLIMAYALNSQLAAPPGADPAQAAQGYASPSQKRLAEITEMIHTASLFHDDVIDKVNHLRHINHILLPITSNPLFPFL